MPQYLVIVESPAKAKTIGKFLGKDYKIEASMGHLRDLPKSQLGVDVEHDFEPKYITIRGKGDLIAKLKREAKAAKKVYLATDPDREGEAISWHLARILDINEKDNCRITFNEITKNAVKNAIKSPRPLDMDLVDAQQARRILDRVVGYNLSPLLWKKVRKGLSAGRVQSVATRLIVDREEEIERFVPEEFWTLTAKMHKIGYKSAFEARFYGTPKEKMELPDRESTEKVLQGLEAASWQVGKVKKGEKRKSPAAPFTTSTLQQEASRKLSFTTKKTMMLAQQLYEGVEVEGEGALGLVTYIRTDSMRVSEEAQVEAKAFIEERWGKRYLPESARVFKNKNASQDAHEAIRPTHLELTPEKIKASLTNDQYKLYKLIWERFVASQMANAVYDTISADIHAGPWLFKASGSKVAFDGFMTLYIEGRDEEEDDGETILPELTEDEKLGLKLLDDKQHFTQPPPRYTEATLIRALEEKGIGRPSTYAPTISTILDRGYVIKEKKAIMPTELGCVVTDIMKSSFANIVDVTFTSNMEKRLDDVEDGGRRWVDILREFYGPFAEDLKVAEEEVAHVQLTDEVTDELCEKCGRNMVIKHGRFGKFLACPGFPDCRNARPIFEDSGALCPKCGGRLGIRKTRKQKKYLGCENYPTCDFVSWDMPSGEPCPSCGSFLVKKYINRKPGLKCANPVCTFEKAEGTEKSE